MNRSIALTGASLALFVFGWFWIAANFTAQTGAWWNSWWSFQAMFATGTVLGFIGFKCSPTWVTTANAIGATTFNVLSLSLWIFLHLP